MIIGAGPYGLALAAHMNDNGSAPRIFGEPMSYWQRHMPAGMCLRSSWRASWIASPGDRLSLPAYERHIGRPLARPVPLEDFIAYGHWFQEQAVAQVEQRKVTSLARSGAGFGLGLDEGEQLEVERVVIATGLDGFTHRPEPFASLPDHLVTHTADHDDLSALAGRRVLVVGGGQSAIESATLALEAGAEVRVLIRKQMGIRWLTRSAHLHATLGPVGKMLYSPTDVGPAGMSWVVSWPSVMRTLPRDLRMRMVRRCLRPAASDWLRPRFGGAEVVVGRHAVAAESNGSVKVRLDDGRTLEADHVLLGTGFRPDIAAIPFLAPELLAQIERVGGLPVLRPGMETSVDGLHVVGALAAGSFGPVTRFVSGTWSTAPAVVQALKR